MKETKETKELDERFIVHSADEYVEKMRDYVQSYKLVNGKISKVDQLYDLFLRTHHVVRHEVVSGKKPLVIYYAYNMETRIYDRIEVSIKQFFNMIRDLIDISSYRSVYNGVIFLFEGVIKGHEPLIHEINLPPRHLIMLRNGYLDLKSKRFYLFKEATGEIKDYHFLRRLDINYKPIANCDKFMVEVINRVLDDWSDGDANVRTYLLQILFATIEGYGRHVSHVIRSNGGDGKSTFIDINKRLAGDGYYVDMNLNQFDDDNLINQLDMSTALVAGDDLPSTVRINGATLASFKTLISGKSRQASVKFENNVVVQTNAVFIQATNSDFQVPENKVAVADRFIVMDWPNINFRQNPVTDFNLDNLLKKDAFIETILAHVAAIDYFDKFDVPEQFKMNSQQLLNDGDYVMQYVNYLRSCSVFGFEYLPDIVLYKGYESWLRLYNSGSKPLSTIKFNKRMSEILAEHGYYLLYNDNSTTKAYRSIDYLEKSGLSFSLQVFNDLTGLNIIIENVRTSYYVNENHTITEDFIKTVEDKIMELGYIPDDFKSICNYAMAINYLAFINPNPIIAEKLLT